MDTSSLVQSLSRSLKLIELLGDSSGTGMTITALCEAARLHKSTVHRLLAALKAHGYVAQDANSAYRLTFKFCQLSRQIINGVGLVNVARRHLRALSEATRETVHLMTRENCSAVYLHREDCAKTALGAVLSIGKYLPLHTTSAGKSILATLDDAEVSRYWEQADKRKLTEHTIDVLDDLRADLEETRKLGYAIDNEENLLGVRCMGIALPGLPGAEMSAISIAGTKERMTDAKMREFKDSLLRTRDDIMGNMGYSPI